MGVLFGLRMGRVKAKAQAKVDFIPETLQITGDVVLPGTTKEMHQSLEPKCRSRNPPGVVGGGGVSGIKPRSVWFSKQSRRNAIPKIRAEEPVGKPLP